MKCKMLLTLAVLASLAIGCSRRQSTEDTVFNSEDPDFVLMVLLDLSPSFGELMAEDGFAYDFSMQVVDKYFRDRIGTDDKLIIGQISGGRRSLLWAGKPLDLRNDYPTADSFRAMLLKKANASGSRVHESITQAIRYCIDESAITAGKAKPALFIVSDMMQNSGDNSLAETITALEDFGRAGGTVGIWFCDLLEVEPWRQRLKDAGIKHFTVEADIVSRPSLPSFD